MIIQRQTKNDVGGEGNENVSVRPRHDSTVGVVLSREVPWSDDSIKRTN